MSGYFASHMTYTRQALANNAKDPIPGLHRPPGHSTLRSSEHMQYMCPEAALWTSATDRRVSCFS